MLKMIIGLFLFASVLIGCSTPQVMWSKDGGSQQEFNRDKYECVQQSRTSWSGGGSGDLGLIMIFSSQSQAEKQSAELFKMCMEARGYTVTEVDQDELTKINEQTAEQKLRDNSSKQQYQEKLKLRKEAEETAKQKLSEDKERIGRLVSTHTINGNDVLIDAENMLMWPKLSNVVDKKMSWQDAFTWVNRYNYAGYNDWRLPTVKELYYAFLYFDRFDNITHYNYWSSMQDDDLFSKQFDMVDGKIGNILKTHEVYVLPVRDNK